MQFSKKVLCMGFKVNSINIQPPSFQGTHKRTNEGLIYYHTNTGLKAGSVLGGMQLLLSLPAIFKQPAKASIPAIFVVGISAGCGAVVDYIRNKKAQQTALTVKKLGVKQALLSNDDIALSRKGRPYYESNNGLKYGALLGAGAGVLKILMALPEIKRNEKSIQEVLTPKQFKASMLLGSIIPAVIGGLIMGAITDHFTNKDASKHA